VSVDAGNEKRETLLDDVNRAIAIRVAEGITRIVFWFDGSANLRCLVQECDGVRYARFTITAGHMGQLLHGCARTTPRLALYVLEFVD
jgi:hypothetical protein